MSFVRRIGCCLPLFSRGRSFVSNEDGVYQLMGNVKGGSRSVVGGYQSEFAATFSSLDMLNMTDYGQRPIIPFFEQNQPNLLENSRHFQSFSTKIDDFKLIQDSHFMIEAKYEVLPSFGRGILETSSNGVCIGMDGDSEAELGLASFHGWAPFFEYNNNINNFFPIDSNGNRLWQYYKNNNDQTNVFDTVSKKGNYPSNAAAVLKSIKIQFGDWITQHNKQISIDFNNPSNIIGMCSGKDIITFKLPQKRNKFLKLYSTKQFENLGLNTNGKILNNMVGSPFLLTDEVIDVHGKTLSPSEVFSIYGNIKSQPWIGLDGSHITENWIKQVAIVDDNTKRLLNHALPFLPTSSGSAGLIEPGYQLCVHIRSCNEGSTSVSNDATLVDETVLSKY